MSHEKISLINSTLDIGCYRKRISFKNNELFFINKNNIYNKDLNFIFQSNYKLFDILTYQNNLITIDSKGDIYLINENGNSSCLFNEFPGIFSGIDLTTSFLISIHDLSHNVNIIDPNSMKVVNSLTLPGIPSGLSITKNESFITIDDRTFSIIDSRNPKEIERSSLLTSPPTALFSDENNIYIILEDRKLRIYDQRRLKAPMKMTKPASKNGSSSIWTNNGNEIISFGIDESMTLVDVSNDIGQFKRKKFLSESPWISSPIFYNNKLYSLSRSGLLYSFINPIDFLKNNQEINEEED